MRKEAIRGFRLSPQQTRLWRLRQKDNDGVYRARCAVVIEGDLDTEILKAALHDVVSRHEILRTSFVLLPGMAFPLQVANENAEVEILNYPAINDGSLLNISLLTQSTHNHLLFVDAPSLYMDTAGLRNFVRALADEYAARLNGETLADEQLQYVAISEWLNQLLESEDTEIGKEFWRKQVVSAPNPPKLPFETQSVESEKFVPQSVVTKIDQATVQKIDLIAERYNVSVSAILLACWQVLLASWMDGSDLVIGVACDGRTDEELQSAIGLLERYVPVVCESREDLPFGMLLRDVNSAVNDAYAWQETFVWLQYL